MKQAITIKATGEQGVYELTSCERTTLAREIFLKDGDDTICAFVSTKVQNGRAIVVRDLTWWLDADDGYTTTDWELWAHADGSWAPIEQ